MSGNRQVIFSRAIDVQAYDLDIVCAATWYPFKFNLAQLGSQAQYQDS